MTDRELIQLLLDEAAYWREGWQNGGIHPDGEDESSMEICELAAKRLEELTITK